MLLLAWRLLRFSALPPPAPPQARAAASASAADPPATPPAAPPAPANSAPFPAVPADPPSLVLDRTLPTEVLSFQEYAHNDSARGERLCRGAGCSSARFLMVDMKRESSDGTLAFVARIEGRVQEVFSAVLASEPGGCEGVLWRGASPWCRPFNSGGPPPVVMDVGSNAGFYSLYSAALGARVLAVDPQPQCAHYVRAGALLSGLGARVTALNGFATASEAAEHAHVRLRSGCWGTYPVVSEPSLNAAAREYDLLPGGAALRGVPGLELATLIRRAAEGAGEEGVLLLKMDAEGAEAGLIEHLEATGVLGEHLVKNFVIEVNKYAVRRGFPDSPCAKDVEGCFAALFERFQRAGYLVLVHEPFSSLPILNASEFSREGWRWADFWFVAPRTPPRDHD